MNRFALVFVTALALVSSAAAEEGTTIKLAYVSGVRVPCDSSWDTRVKAGNFEWQGIGISESAFPLQIRCAAGETERQFELVLVDNVGKMPMKTAALLAAIAENGLEPAAPEHLFALAAARPQLQEKTEVVAPATISSVTANRDTGAANRFALKLTASMGKRGLSTAQMDSDTYRDVKWGGPDIPGFPRKVMLAVKAAKKK